MPLAANIGLTVLVIVAGAATVGSLERLLGGSAHRAIGWAVAALLIVLIWVPSWPLVRKRAAGANNALYAEHALGFVELTERNPSAHQLGQQLISTVRRLNPNLGNDGAIIAVFNGKPRLSQLNLIAMAMMDLKQSAMLGDVWQPPSEAAEPSPRAVAAASAEIFNKHGVQITIPERRFRIERGCLIDGSEAGAVPAPKPPPPDLMRQAIYGAFAFFLEQTKDERVEFNDYHVLIFKSYVAAISIPISTAEPVVAIGRFADLPEGWEHWAVSAIVDELFRMVRDQIYKA